MKLRNNHKMFKEIEGYRMLIDFIGLIKSLIDI